MGMKIDIISGFLGAGKTTLIKKLIAEAYTGEKLVLIENEFGEIGIDGGFLKEAGVQITEMNSGCICCSLVGDFGVALHKVIEQFHPDRILIEPSGVGKLSDVILAVQKVQKEEKDLVLNSFVTVADVTKCNMYMKNFGEFYNNQIENAGTIILSRTQKVNMDKLNICVQQIREHNPNAAIITTPWEELEGKQIIKAMEQKNELLHDLLEEEEICPVCGHHHEHEDHVQEGHKHEEHAQEGHKHEEHAQEGHKHEEHVQEGHKHEEHVHAHHHAEEVFTSWGKETPRSFTTEEVKGMLESLINSEEYGVILRAKGILSSVSGEWIYFDLVPGEYEIRLGKPDYTGRLCLIGTNLKVEEIEKLFHLH